MSYVLDFAPDAKSQWLELPVWELQELVLDHQERIRDRVARRSARGHRRAPQKEMVHVEFEHTAGRRHVVFLALVVDPIGKRITVTGVGHAVRHVGQ